MPRYCKSCQKCCLWPEIRHRDDNEHEHTENSIKPLSERYLCKPPCFIYTNTGQTGSYFRLGSRSQSPSRFSGEAGSTLEDPSSSQTKHPLPSVFRLEEQQIMTLSSSLFSCPLFGMAVTQHPSQLFNSPETFRGNGSFGEVLKSCFDDKSSWRRFFYWEVQPRRGHDPTPSTALNESAMQASSRSVKQQIPWNKPAALK